MNEMKAGAVLIVGFLALAGWFVTDSWSTAAAIAFATAVGIAFGYGWARHEATLES